MLLLIICLTFLDIIGNIEAILNDPRTVNVALETVLAFNNRDNDRNIKFIDEFQNFLSKVKETVANTGRRNIAFKTGQRKKFDNEEELKFSEFIKKLIDILKNYQDDDLVDVFAVIDDEIRKYHYKGCKFYELISNNNVRRYVANTLDQVKNVPGKVLKKKLDVTLQAIENAKYKSKQTEMIDFINSLYTKRDVAKLQQVLNNFDMYKVKSKRANVDIIKVVRDSIRSVFFDHYSDLNQVIRQDLKNNIEEFISKNVYDQEERDPNEVTSELEVTTTDKTNIAREISELPKMSTVPKPILREKTGDIVNFDFKFDNNYKIHDKNKITPKVKNSAFNFDIGRNNLASTERDVKILDKKNEEASISTASQDITALKHNYNSDTASDEFTDQAINIEETVTVNIQTTKNDFITDANHNKKHKISKNKHKLRDNAKNTKSTIHETSKKIKHKKKRLKKKHKKESIASSGENDSTSDIVHVTEMADDLKLPMKKKNQNYHYIPPTTKKLKKKKNIKKQESDSISENDTDTKKTSNVFKSLQNVIQKISNKIQTPAVEDVKSELENINEVFVSKHTKKKKKHRKDVAEIDDDAWDAKKSFSKLKKKNIRTKETQRHKKKQKKVKVTSKSDISSSADLNSSLSNEFIERELKTKSKNSKKIKKHKRIKVRRREQKNSESSIEKISTSVEDAKQNVASKINAINEYIQNRYTTPKKMRRTKGLTVTTMKSIQISESLEKMSRKKEQVPPIYVSRSIEDFDRKDENPATKTRHHQRPPKKYMAMEIPIKAYMSKNYRTLRQFTPTLRSINKHPRRFNEKDNFDAKNNPKPFIALEDFERMNKEIEKLERESPKDLLEEKFGIKTRARDLFWKDPIYGEDKAHLKFRNGKDPTEPELPIGAFEVIREDSANSTIDLITTPSLPVPKFKIEDNTNKFAQKRAATSNAQASKLRDDHRIDLNSFVSKTNQSLSNKFGNHTQNPITFKTTVTVDGYENKSDNVKTDKYNQGQDIVKNNGNTSPKNENTTNYDYFADVNFNAIKNITKQEDFEKFMDYEYTTAVTKAKRINMIAPDYKEPQEIIDIYDKNMLNAYKSMKHFKEPALGDLGIIGGRIQDFDQTLPPENTDRAFIYNATISR